MCLRKILKKHSHPLKERIAYKIFRVTTDVWLGENIQTIKTPYKYFYIKLGVLYKAENKAKEKIATDKLLESYNPGFHVYQTLEDAKKALNVLFQNWESYKIFKVKINKIKYTGTDGTSDVPDFIALNLKNWVADEMTVLEEVKDNATV